VYKGLADTQGGHKAVLNIQETQHLEAGLEWESQASQTPQSFAGLAQDG
jgi:hypothetical protein